MIEWVKKRQRWVLEHPCRTIQECGKLGYRLDLSLPGGNFVATVLTIDLFSDPLAWHSDVAILDASGKGKPVALWSVADRAAAFDLARRMLAGVGQTDREGLDCDNLKVGFVRPLTSAEAQRVIEIGRRRPLPEPTRIGEVGIYDFNDSRTEADENIFAPQSREIIYADEAPAEFNWPSELIYVE